MRPLRLLPAVLGTALLAPALVACGQGQDLFELCQLERFASESAHAKRTGMRSRRVASGAPSLQLAEAGVQHTQEALRACLDGHGLRERIHAVAFAGDH